jgi:hypothetical protein
MRKFRASTEPFWDLKIGKYNLTPVSSEYLISCELLSPTSTADRTSHVFLAYVIPWINKASLALSASVPRPTDLKFGSCTALSSSSTSHPCGLNIKSCHYRGLESVSDSISAIQAPTYMCTHCIDDPLPHSPLRYWGYGHNYYWLREIRGARNKNYRYILRAL